MGVRPATESDRETLQALWREFSGPIPPWVERAEEETFAQLDRALDAGTAFVAERDGEVVGLAAGVPRGSTAAELTELYVRPAARRGGIGTELVRAVLGALDAQHVHVAVGVDNDVARAFYRKLGFRPEQLLLRRDAAPDAAEGLTFGSVHVQTDDQHAVQRAVVRFVPRLSASRTTVVSPARDGWVVVYDEAADRDPAALRQLGRELSNVLGSVVFTLGVEGGQVVRYIAFEQGRLVDEYLSVPEYHGPLPPGDVVAMRANATVVARLTGADPAAVRAIARTAASVEELPPAAEHVGELARALGLTGAEIGFDAAPEVGGTVVVEHR